MSLKSEPKNNQVPQAVQPVYATGLLFLFLLLRPALATPSAVVEGNSQFAWDLYTKLSSSQGNVFFSPFSISSALSMTYAGAKGNTAAEMARVLHFPQQGGEAAWRGLLGDLMTPQKSYQFSIANRIWPNKEFLPRPAFLKVVQNDYFSSVQSLDYHQAEGARKTINDWVAAQTQNKIKDLIPSGILTPLTRMVLTNAIYFKGNWSSAFLERATRQEPFTDSQGKVAPCQLMYQESTFGYAQVDSVQVLDMPYQGERLSLTVLLPKDGQGLRQLEQHVDWPRFIAEINPQQVKVSLPRYKVEAQFLLNDALISLGMRQAFDENSSDLSGICESGGRKLFISQVIHKAFIEVNEKGTEASAATAVVVSVRGMAFHPQAVEFRADHAFLYAIRDQPTGSILFLGRLERP